MSERFSLNPDEPNPPISPEATVSPPTVPPSSQTEALAGDTLPASARTLSGVEPTEADQSQSALSGLHRWLGARKDSLLEGTTETAIHIKDTSVIALTGLRRVIAERGERRAAKAAADLSKSAVVRQKSVEAVMRNRLPAREFQPITRKEQGLAVKAARKREKIIAKEYEKDRAQRIYGSRDHRGELIYTHVTLGEKKKIKPTTTSDGMMLNDLGTPAQNERLENGRYTRARKRSEKRINKQFNAVDEAARRIRTELEGVVSSDDPKMERKISRKISRATRLAARQEMLARKETAYREKRANRLQER